VGGTARGLVIEDNHLIALYLQDVLGELGYRDVLVAHDLATGFTLLGSVKPERAVLDVRIGIALIYPLAEALLRQHVPFIFYSDMPRTSLPPQWRSYPLVSKFAGKTFRARALDATRPMQLLVQH
jgi:hypothetical protein